MKNDKIRTSYEYHVEIKLHVARMCFMHVSSFKWWYYWSKKKKIKNEESFFKRWKIVCKVRIYFKESV